MPRERRIFTPRTGMPASIPVVDADCLGREIQLSDCNRQIIRLFPQDQITVAEVRADKRTLLCLHSSLGKTGLLIIDLHDTQPAKL